MNGYLGVKKEEGLKIKCVKLCNIFNTSLT